MKSWEVDVPQHEWQERDWNEVFGLLVQFWFNSAVVLLPLSHKLSVFFFLPQEGYFLLKRKNIFLVTFNSLAGLGHTHGIRQEEQNTRPSRSLHTLNCVYQEVFANSPPLPLPPPRGLIVFIPFQNLGKGPAMATWHPVVEELGPFPALCTVSAALCAVSSPWKHSFRPPVSKWFLSQEVALKPFLYMKAFSSSPC